MRTRLLVAAALLVLPAPFLFGGDEVVKKQDIERDLWAKLLYNCALNPLGALIGVPYGELGRHRETRAILEAVVHEIFGLRGVLAQMDRQTQEPRGGAVEDLGQQIGIPALAVAGKQQILVLLGPRHAPGLGLNGRNVTGFVGRPHDGGISA